MSSPELDELQVTAVMRRRAPAWWWLRDNFKLPAVLTIAGLIVGGGGWLLSEHLAVKELQAKVAAQKPPDLTALEVRVNTLELQQAALPPRLNAIEGRVADQEENWRGVVREAQHQVPREWAPQTGRKANRPGR